MTKTGQTDKRKAESTEWFHPDKRTKTASPTLLAASPRPMQTVSPIRTHGYGTRSSPFVKQSEQNDIKSPWGFGHAGLEVQGSWPVCCGKRPEAPNGIEPLAKCNAASSAQVNTPASSALVLRSANVITKLPHSDTDTIASLRQQLNEARKKAASSADSANSHKDAHAKLKKSAAANKQHLSAMSKGMDRLKTQIENQNKELTSLRKVIELYQSHEEVGADSAGPSGKGGENGQCSKNELDPEADLFRGLNDTVNEQQQQIVRLRKQVSELEHTVSASEDALARSKDDFEELQKQISVSDASMPRADPEELDLLKQEMEAMRAKEKWLVAEKSLLEARLAGAGKAREKVQKEAQADKQAWQRERASLESRIRLNQAQFDRNAAA